MNVKRYNDFILNEAKVSFEGSIGDWIFIIKDKESEYYGDESRNNRLGQIIANKYKYNEGINIKFVEKLKDYPESNSQEFDNHDKLKYDIVDKEIVKDFNGGKLLPLIKSDKLHMILNLIKFKYESYFNDSTYFDITNENDSISFLPLNKSKSEDKWTSKNRQTTRIGRLFRKLNPTLKDAEIEEFVNKYKARYDTLINKIDERIKIVKGEEIRKWYLKENYAKGDGNLNNSCMRYKKSQKRFDVYCNYPDKIGLMILTDNENKLLCRSLVWKLDEPKGKIYMDTTYSINDYFDDVFNDYAKKNNMMTWDDIKSKDMKINDIIIDNDPKNNPYMDTFNNYNVDKKFLSNVRDYKKYRTDNYLYLTDHD